LELAFDSKSLRTTCENESQAKLELGATVAEILKHRLADLRAARSVKDLVAGRSRAVGSAGSQHMAVDLCNGYSIVFTLTTPIIL
jgi:proteic killer suppression protein